MRTVTEAELLRYEGLVFKHATRIVNYVELDLDDIRQVYRLKVWRALLAFDPTRSSMDQDRFVFSCLKNAEKDLLKKKRHNEVPVEKFDVTLVVTEDAIYGGILEDAPLVPNTLDQLERRVVALLYAGYAQTEAARRLGIHRSAMDRLMRSVRAKMADWTPETPVPTQRAALPESSTRTAAPVP